MPAASIEGTPTFSRYPNLAMDKNWVVLFHKGIEINFEFKVNGSIRDTRESRFDPERTDDSPDQLRFLSRLASGWTFHDEPMVQRWRRHYDVEALAVRRVVSEFTLAAKELEDMHAAIGGARGLNPYLGSHVVGKLLRAILATHGYFSIGEKWLRKVDRLITSGSATASLLVRGRELLFPRLLEDEGSERRCFRDVLAFTREVQSFLSADAQVGMLLEWASDEFDTIN